MLSTKPVQRSSSPRKKIRLMKAREAPQACSIPACHKPATGEMNGQFYCREHFLAAVRQHWD
jgi:hypothetical protein